MLLYSYLNATLQLPNSNITDCVTQKKSAAHKNRFKVLVVIGDYAKIYGMLRGTPLSHYVISCG